MSDVMSLHEIVEQLRQLAAQLDLHIEGHSGGPPGGGAHSKGHSGGPPGGGVHTKGHSGGPPGGG